MMSSLGLGLFLSLESSHLSLPPEKGREEWLRSIVSNSLASLRAALGIRLNNYNSGLIMDNSVHIFSGALADEESRHYYRVVFHNKDLVSYQSGNNAVIGLFDGKRLKSDEKLVFEVSHELCHLFGCFHSHEGLMAGKQANEEGTFSLESPVSLLIDEFSSRILKRGPLLRFEANASKNINVRKDCRSGAIRLRCQNNFTTVILGRGSFYLEVIDVELENCEISNEIEIDPGLADTVVVLLDSGALFRFSLASV